LANLLFLHAMYPQKISSYQAARRLGHRVTVAGPELPEWAAPYVHRHVRLSTHPPDEMPAALDKLRRVHAADPFDGVVTFWDHGVIPAAEVAEALGLPGGHSAAARAARNKADMRAALAAAGVPCPAAARVVGWGELCAAAERIGYPAIYKPTGGAGSAGIFLVDSPDRLRAVYEKGTRYAAPNADQFFEYYPHEFVYETYMTGIEVSVEGVVSRGEIQISGVTDKRVAADTYFTEYQNAFPAQVDDTAAKDAADLAGRAVRALGLDGVGFHVEVMLTASGSKVVEVNARLGGGFIASHLVPLAGGDDLLKAAFDAAIGRRVELGATPTSGSCNQYLLASDAGTIRAWKGLEEARNQPGVVELGVLKDVGDQVLLPPDSFFSHQLAHIVTIGADTAQAITRAEHAVSLLRCEIGLRQPLWRKMSPSPRTMNRPLLLLGGASADPGRDSLDQAAARDLPVWLADKPENLTARPELTARAAHVVELPYDDAEACVTWARSQDTVFRGVYGFREQSVEAVAAVAQALSLPGNGLATARLIRDKHACRQALRAAGFRQPHSVLCHDRGEAKEVLASIPGPWVVKPPVGQGSTGVTLLETPEDLDQALEHTGSSVALVESFQPGREYSVEGVCVKGEPTVLVITEKVTTGPPHFVELGHAMPADAPRETAAVVEAALRALGIAWGVFHVECWVDDGEVILGEVHNRPGGDHIHTMTQYVTGVELHGAVFDQLLDRTACLPPPSRGAAIRFLTPPPGRVTRVDGWNAVAGDHRVLKSNLDLAPGTIQRPITSSDDRSSFVVATGRTAAEAIRTAEELCAMIDIVVTP
jgi:biotin carboxylase